MAVGSRGSEIVGQGDRLRSRDIELCRCRAKLHGKGAGLEIAKGSGERIIGKRRVADRLLLSIDLACRSDWSSKTDADIALCTSIEFNDTHDDLVAEFSFFHREDSDAVAADLQQRELLPERAGMLCTLECDQGLVQAVGMPI